MKKWMIMPGVVALALTATLAPSYADVKPQSIAELKVDVTKLSTGYRASKIVGSTVYNDANNSIGTVDDLLVNPDDRVFYAIVSVGGFLGVGSKLVAVPYTNLEVNGTKIMIAGATKEALKQLPEFKYNTRSN